MPISAHQWLKGRSRVSVKLSDEFAYNETQSDDTEVSEQAVLDSVRVGADAASARGGLHPLALEGGREFRREGGAFVLQRGRRV